MADEEAPVGGAAEDSDDRADHTADTDAPEPRQERMIPYRRFREVNEAYKTVKQAHDEMRQRLDDLETRDQSSAERERRRREQLERELDEFRTKSVRLERERWIRDAAREARFDDPADAVAFIDISDLEVEEDAAAAVRDLAKRKPRLLIQDRPDPKIGQVIKDGQAVQSGQQRRRAGVSDLDPEAQAFIAQLQQKQKEAGWHSVAFSDDR